jgi:hypothetical protein
VLDYGKGKSVGKHLMLRRLNRHPLAGEDANHNGLVHWIFELSDSSYLLDPGSIVNFAVLLQKIGCKTQGIYPFVTKNRSIELFGETNNKRFFAEQQDGTAEEEISKQQMNDNDNHWI